MKINTLVRMTDRFEKLCGIEFDRQIVYNFFLYLVQTHSFILKHKRQILVTLHSLDVVTDTNLANLRLLIDMVCILCD